MYWIRTALSVLLLSVPLTLSPAHVFAAESVADVGGVAITRFELQRQKQKILPMEVGFHGKISKEKLDEIEKKALQALVEQAYKVRYALDKELSVDNASVEDRFQKVRKRFADDDALGKALGDEGISAFRGSLYRELLAERAEKEAVDSRVIISEEEIRAFFKDNESNYRRPKQFSASHILLKVDPSATAEERKKVKKKAEELLARASAGEDFYNLAYFNSDDRSKFVGGNLGSFHQGQTVREFEEALLKMKPGEIAGPVRTMYGYHIIKLDKVDEPRQMTYEEVREKIGETLRSRKHEALYAEWMKDLKIRYPAEIKQK